MFGVERARQITVPLKQNNKNLGMVHKKLPNSQTDQDRRLTYKVHFRLSLKTEPEHFNLVNFKDDCEGPR